MKNNLIAIHNEKYQQNKQNVLKEVQCHEFVKSNNLYDIDFLKYCFVDENILYAPVYNYKNDRVGYIGYDNDGFCIHNFDLKEPVYSIISSGKNAFNKDKSIYLEERTSVFFAPDYLTASSFYQVHKNTLQDMGYHILIINYITSSRLDSVICHFLSNLSFEYEFNLIFNNTHEINQIEYKDTMIIKGIEDSVAKDINQVKFYYPPIDFKKWVDVNCCQEQLLIKKVITDFLIKEDHTPLTKFEAFVNQLPKEIKEDKDIDLNESSNIKLNLDIKQITRNILLDNLDDDELVNHTGVLDNDEDAQRIYDEFIKEEMAAQEAIALQETIALTDNNDVSPAIDNNQSNFLQECLDGLSKEYKNIPKQHLEGLLRNIVANTLQRVVKFNDKTPITDQSIFVLSSGEGKTSLAESLTNNISDWYNDYQYELFKKDFADYLATKEYLDNQIKDNKNNLELLKKLKLELIENEDNKPYCQTLMQTMNTSSFNIPEEVLKGARQNWLFSDEAGATMNSLAWKGDNGNALIQFLCGAWSDTSKLSNFKTDIRSKAPSKASKTEIRDCSYGMLAMTQHGFFDKLDKDVWIDGGWIARLNLYICDRKELTIKNRQRIIEIGEKFQNNLINLFQKILNDKQKYLYPQITKEAEQIFNDNEYKAIETANRRKDEQLDPIYNRLKEKAQRLATIYAIVEYLDTDKFEITKEIAEKAVKDTWYNIGQSIDFIVGTRGESIENNPREIEECILKAHKNNKYNEFIGIRDITNQAKNKTRQNTMYKYKEYIYDYLESQCYKDPKVIRIQDDDDVYWFDVIKTGKIRVSYKLRCREEATA